MKRTTAAVSGLSRIVFAAAAFCWAFYFLVVITEQDGVSLSAAVPLMCLAVSYCAGIAASRRQTRLLIYILVQIVICAAGVAAMQFLIKAGQDASGLRLTSSIALVCAAAVCARAAALEIDPSQIAHRFDAGLLLFAVLLLADHYLKGSYGKTALSMLASAMLLLLLSLAMIRTDKNAAIGSSAGKAIPFIILAVIILIAAAVAAVGSGAAGSAAGAVVYAVRALLGAIGSAAVFLWSKWSAFCAWLATLFEPGEGAPVDMDTPEQQTEVPEIAEPSRLSVIMLYALTALIAAAIIFALIYMIRSARLRKRRTLRLNNRQAVRQGGITDGLRAAVSELMKKMKYRAECVRFRNTPAGLLAWCETHVPRSDRKLPSESGPQFLARLAEKAEGPSSDAFRTLSELVEKDFYSPRPAAADHVFCAEVRRATKLLRRPAGKLL